MDYEAALLGDPNAKELYKRSAYEHSLTIKALIRELDFSELEVVPVSYDGGVFKAGEFILRPLRDFLEDSNVDLQWYSLGRFCRSDFGSVMSMRSRKGLQIAFNGVHCPFESIDKQISSKQKRASFAKRKTSS